ncbi:MAG: UDP-N-acetylmuramoyl-tripeptide--D-alanyl-D-alanine ligase [Wenzhouxiangellaceae bacterium]|nr:UDP-N-acetylmuramoyl-tripeptide--D-alanyl-D-alanine ligase [Wenzhouxiangellaceae bacterium]
MIQFDLQQAAELTGGVLHRPEQNGVAENFVGMTQDSRNLRAGNLYAALVGERFDGHRFLADVAASGAAAALVSRRVDAPIAQIQVDNVVRAMGDLARAWRSRMPARLVGVTGSNGKTTVKTMLAAVLSRCAPTLATRGNFNNELGVPLTLSALGDQHRYGVIEMGCGQPGDIQYLASIVAPQVGLVTNAGPAHLERLGSVEGVARTKGELFSSLGAHGIAVINRDDAFFEFWCGLCENARVLSFGIHPQAEVRWVSEARHDWVETPNGRFELQLQLPGRHNRLNALAATAAALALGLDLDPIAAGLAGVGSLPGRLNARQMPGDWTLIDDSYNANPASTRAALEVLAETAGKRWLVLGDMAELGGDAELLHSEIGQAARQMGVDRLFAIGRRAAFAADAFGVGAEHFDCIEDLAQRLAEELEPGLTCLVKGSRSMQMDQVVARLHAAEAARC